MQRSRIFLADIYTFIKQSASQNIAIIVEKMTKDKSIASHQFSNHVE